LQRLGATGQPMVVLTEGVVPYLDLAEAGALADDLRATPGLVGWIADYLAPESHKYRARRMGRRMGKAQFKFQPADWFAFFAEHGWKARTIEYPADESKRVGRRPPLPWHARVLMKVLGPLAPPEQRDRFRKFAGFVWLAPA
jgi:O-methyltransferase involved in polyketide biosynthesis